mmetsp:Transcript_9464/g.13998  ORF Transcript_9464/g.13998 Transcript_9464/m.13998 type:complete len:306 (-) Transcript_9464:31-948(-)
MKHEEQTKRGRPKGSKAIVNHLISGTSGGIGLAIVGHPFDTLKTFYQTQHGQLNENKLKLKHKTSISPFKNSKLRIPKLYNGENLLHMVYRGLAPPLLMSTAMCAITLGTYGVLHDDYNVNPVIAGSFAGFTAAILLNPFQLMKVQFQLGNHYLNESVSRKLPFGRGVKWVVSQFKEHGMFTIWKRGIWITCARDVVGRGIYFGTYDYLKTKFNMKMNSIWLSSWLAGGTTGIITWSIMLPLDTIKSNIQAIPFHKDPPSILQVIRSTSISRMYAGFFPAILRSFPANAVSLLCYEYTSRYLLQH